ncbi:MAG: metallophosphoesterase family protein [Planctomycetota bacterium]
MPKSLASASSTSAHLPPEAVDPEGRRLVIGDIHGCSKALRTLIECIKPRAEDELVFLGDYVDRGPDSRGVIDQLIELQAQCKVVALRGNHEIMLCGVAFGGLDAKLWLEAGGKATVVSYGGKLDKIPAAHREFFQSLLPHYETEREIFVHACYEASLPMDDQSDDTRYWQHVHLPPAPHVSGKRVFVGHTPQASGMIRDLGYLVCVDTYCFGTGYLTAMDVRNDELIQVDKRGFRRRVPAEILWQWIRAATSKCRKVLTPRMPRPASKSSFDSGARTGRESGNE